MRVSQSKHKQARLRRVIHAASEFICTESVRRFSVMADGRPRQCDYEDKTMIIYGPVGSEHMFVWGRFNLNMPSYRIMSKKFQEFSQRRPMIQAWLSR